MSDVQRWRFAGVLPPAVESKRGEYVLYADHVEALRQAAVDGVDRGRFQERPVAYAQGQRDALARCIAAVEFLHDHNPDQQAGLWAAICELRALGEQ